jgi:cytoskeletal protein RodZ
VTQAPQTVGQTVARARGDAGMTVAQVAATTRIRATLISAIEADDFRLCGGDVYARGHLKSIATAVGIDPASLTAQYDVEHGAARAEASVVEPIAQPGRVRDPGPTAGLSSLANSLGDSMAGARSGANWSAVMALAFVVVIVIGAISVLGRGGASQSAAGTPTPTPAASSATTSSPTPTSSAPSAAPSASPSSSTSSDVVATGDGVTVTLAVTGRASWVRATTQGGKTLFEGTLRNGDSRTFRDKAKVALLLGNAGAVSLVVNGKDLGTPGKTGQVLNTEFVPGDPTNPAA